MRYVNFGYSNGLFFGSLCFGYRCCEIRLSIKNKTMKKKKNHAYSYWNTHMYYREEASSIVGDGFVF